MRRKYIAQGDKWVEVKKVSRETLPTIMPDIKPYQSMIDGSIITSRSRHRAHLKAHGCIEAGKELPPTRIVDTNPEGRHELIREQVMSIPDDRFRKMLNREVQFLKDNPKAPI